MVTSYTRDALYRPTHVEQPGATFDYTYDAYGNRTNAHEDLNGTSYDLTWTYDRANRLTSETRSGASSLFTRTRYTYDAAGNRQTQSVNGTLTTYQYDQMDQLTHLQTTGFNPIDYTYDARGNRLSATEGAVSTQYSYDAMNRLTRIDLPGSGGEQQYAYDALGYRTAADNNGNITRYVWDEASRFGNVIMETDGGGNPTASYVLGRGRIIEKTQEGTTSYYSQDALGSTRALRDSTGAITDTYSYDAFGTMFAQTGSTANNFLYAGQQSDSASGLYSMRARYYDPTLGRFLTRDVWPINTSNPFELNRYLYAGNNPTNMIDPSGHSALVEFNLLEGFINTVEGSIRGAYSGGL